MWEPSNTKQMNIDLQLLSGGGGTLSFTLWPTTESWQREQTWNEAWAQMKTGLCQTEARKLSDTLVT